MVIVQRAQTTWISREGARTHISRGCRVKSHVHFRRCKTEGMKSLSASLTHYCLGKQHRRQERRARRGGKETSEGVLLGKLFAQHPFAAELRTATLVMRSGPPGLRARMPNALGRFRWIRTCWQNYPLVPEQKKRKSLNLDPPCSDALCSESPERCSPRCSQDSTRALL